MVGPHRGSAGGTLQKCNLSTGGLERLLTLTFSQKVCLGHDAKDEFNIVEIIPTKGSQESAPVCIATLKRSVLPMVRIGW